LALTYISKETVKGGFGFGFGTCPYSERGKMIVPNPSLFNKKMIFDKNKSKL